MQLTSFYKKICFVCLPALIIAGCTKDKVPEGRADENMDFSNHAQVQVYNAAVNTQRNHVFVDGKIVTGASLTYTSATFSPLFPSSASGFAVPAGLRNFLIRDTLTAATQPPLVFAENFQSGQFYTIFLYDSLNAVKQKTVWTKIDVPTDTSSRLRFANFVYWRTGTPPPMDVFSKKMNANIFTNVAYTEVTNFIPYGSGFTSGAYNDTLLVRPTGSTGAYLDTLAFTPARGRVYTLVFRGRYETAGASFPRTLSVFANY
jgi:hypothetical protein